MYLHFSSKAGTLTVCKVCSGRHALPRSHVVYGRSSGRRSVRCGFAGIVDSPPCLGDAAWIVRSSCGRRGRRIVRPTQARFCPCPTLVAAGLVNRRLTQVIAAYGEPQPGRRSADPADAERRCCGPASPSPTTPIPVRPTGW
jgi:hypothetical protein